MPFNLQILENLLHQPEGPALDFKRDQYRFNGANDGEKSELLKDIIALANSWRFLTAYILIGVEERKSGRSRVIGVQEHLDDANLHQFVNSKTQRPIEFSYRQFPVEGKEIGVVEIPLQERPYFLTKPFGKLDANEVKVRDGSSTRTATPDEIIRMGTAGIFNDPPALTMEWADIEYRLWFPSPHDVSSLRACLRSLQYVKLRLLPEGVIMSHSYSSDISREQFARILPYLESARRRTKPRTVDLYDVFCGVLYLLKSGCQWRMLPADFPDWRTCYKYFRQWSERPDPAKYSILEQVLKKIGWHSPAKQWSEKTDQLLYRGLPERQEHRQRREQGL